MRPRSFGLSLALHSAVVAWMFLGPPLDSPRRKPAPAQARNLYEQAIAPYEKKIIWYNFRDKLPEVSPVKRRGDKRPPKVAEKTGKQTVVANQKNARKAKQMVWVPAPEVKLERELESPNLMAFAAPSLPPP